MVDAWAMPNSTMSGSTSWARRVRLLGCVCATVAVLDVVGAARAMGAVAAHRGAEPATVSLAHRPAPPLRGAPVARGAPPARPRVAAHAAARLPQPARRPAPTPVARVRRRVPVPVIPSSPPVTSAPPAGPAPTATTQPPSPTTTRPAPTTSAPAPAPSSPPKSSPPAGTSDPSQSIPPDQAYQDACWTSSPDIAKCNQAALADINKARASEGLGPLQLPGDFYSLPVPAQLIAVANAERTSRGLPALAENSNWDRSAQQGAQNGQDPTGPSGYAWASNYSLGDPTALSSDYGWMYDDGPGSNNVDCSSSDPSGCWGHRHNILSPWSGSAGGGTANTSSGVAMAELFVND
ncbi:MAG TPA: hypothetical protein VFP54_11780 [Acidimicrobiales bacterium]|nr:hypothetical protein [Acidimicrobiales bacterium]